MSKGDTAAETSMANYNLSLLSVNGHLWFRLDICVMSQHTWFFHSVLTRAGIDTERDVCSIRGVNISNARAKLALAED